MSSLSAELFGAFLESRLFPPLIKARFRCRCTVARLRSRRRRRVHAYCIGLAKTGTHSVARMFARDLRTRHEPDRHYLITLLPDYYGPNRPTPEHIRRWLIRRDRLHQLELESSCLLAEWLPHLVTTFPSSRYVFPFAIPTRGSTLVSTRRY